MDRDILDNFGTSSAISEYVYGRNGQKKGVLLAFPVSDELYTVGYSLCDPQDRFDKNLGKNLAFLRGYADYQGAQAGSGVAEVLHSFGNLYRSQMSPFVYNILTGLDLNEWKQSYKDIWMKDMPNSIRSQMKEFMKRAKKYYNDKAFCLDL